MNIGVLPGLGLNPAHASLFRAWNALPELYVDGPMFVITPLPDGIHRATISNLLRALAIEHAA
jgi:hypothetical protein